MWLLLGERAVPSVSPRPSPLPRFKPLLVSARAGDCRPRRGSSRPLAQFEPAPRAEIRAIRRWSREGASVVGIDEPRVGSVGSLVLRASAAPSSISGRTTTRGFAGSPVTTRI
jgi:hypothetical protein